MMGSDIQADHYRGTSIIMTDKRLRLSYVIAELLNSPRIADQTKEARRFLLGMMAAIKMALGKEISTRIKMICKDNVKAEDLYSIFLDSGLSELDVDMVCLYLDRSIAYVRADSHKTD